MEFFVFDTNILLSAVFNENSTPGIALKKARTLGTLLVSDELYQSIWLYFPARNSTNGYH
jgi:predicted nucleic acid-binding protein